MLLLSPCHHIQFSGKVSETEMTTNPHRSFTSSGLLSGDALTYFTLFENTSLCKTELGLETLSGGRGFPGET